MHEERLVSNRVHDCGSIGCVKKTLVRPFRTKGVGFCDNSIKALVLKNVTMWEGVSKMSQNPRDVVYGRALTCSTELS